MRISRRGATTWGHSNSGLWVNRTQLDTRPHTSPGWVNDDFIAAQIQKTPGVESTWQAITRVGIPNSALLPILEFGAETPFGPAAIVCAGGGIVSPWLNEHRGQSTWGKFTDGAWLLENSRDGLTALCPQYQVGRNIELRTQGGVITRTVATGPIRRDPEAGAAVRIDGKYLAAITLEPSFTENVWDMDTGERAPILFRDAVHFIVPVVIGGVLWLFERTGGQDTGNAMISLRQANTNVGIVIARTDAYEPDACLVSNVVECRWMAASGGTLDRYREAHVDVTTAPTELLFGDGPIEPPDPPQPPADNSAAIAELEHAKSDIDRAIALLRGTK